MFSIYTGTEIRSFSPPPNIPHEKEIFEYDGNEGDVLLETLDKYEIKDKDVEDFILTTPE